MKSERGQTAAEYLGLLVVCAVVLGAIAASPLGGLVGGGIRDAICAVAGEECESKGGPAAVARADAVQERLDALAGFVAAQGGSAAEIEEQVRAALAAGDLDTAERLLERLELVADLTSAGPRGPFLDDLLTASDDDFAALVEDGTIYLDDGRYNTAYFQLDPAPGGGVVVMDYFIDSGSSGVILSGDDREHVDPLRSDLPLDASRVMIVVDLETGRGQILQSETCGSVVIAGACNEPRPIALDGEVLVNDGENDATGEGINIDQTNQFDVEATPDGFSLDYDLLNSITPLVVSVDGSVSFGTTDDGGLEIREDDRDDYPSIGTYYYPEPGETQVVEQREQESVGCGALPVNIC